MSYGSSLQCPCSKTSLTYQSFVQLSGVLHQVCSSPFVETAWIDNILGDGNWSNVSMNEFRIRGVVYFLVLRSLCDMTGRAVYFTIRDYVSVQIFKGKMISEDQLTWQLNNRLNQSEMWNRIDLNILIVTIRGTIQSSQLMTVFSSNWVYSSEYDPHTPYNRIPTKPVSHGSNCSCAYSANCTEPVYIDGQIVPGFVLGCFPMESLLRSTLTCLCNQTCIQQINAGNLSSIHSLNASLSDRFMPNTTVEEMFTNGFVERWSFNISYSKFFSECAPSYCTYTESQKKNTLQIIAILLGLYGGLTLILRLVVPNCVALFNRLIFLVKSKNNRIVPDS